MGGRKPPERQSGTRGRVVKTNWKIFAIVMLAGATLALPPTSASGDACTSPLSTTPFVAGELPQVVQTRSRDVDVGVETCASGTQFRSEAFSCMTLQGPITGGVNGAYCGIAVDPQQSIRCRWRQLSNSVATALYVGWDLSGNGHIRASDTPTEVVYGPMAEDTDAEPRQYTLTNTDTVARRFIAMPTNIDHSNPTGGANDITYVGCSLVV